MPQQPAIGDDVSALMPQVGEDVTALMASHEQSSPEKSVGGFLSNIGSDISGMADAVRHPIDTASAMASGLGEAMRRSNDVSFRQAAPPDRTLAQAGDESYARPVSTALQFVPFMPASRAPLQYAGAGLRRVGARTLETLETPLGGAVVGGASGYAAGGVPGAAVGALAGATNGPKVIRDLRRLASDRTPPTPPLGARLVRSSPNEPLEQTLVNALNDIRQPQVTSVGVKPQNPAGGGFTSPPDVPIPTDKTPPRRLAPFAKTPQNRYRELTGKTVLTPDEANELAMLEPIVKKQAQSAGMSYAAGGSKSRR
jgi:hypothetical protein